MFRFNASYNSNKSSWDSYILTGYGVMKQGDGKLIKNDDKLLTVTLNAQLIYDYDIKCKEIDNGVTVDKPKVQFKEVFGLGLSYNF